MVSCNAYSCKIDPLDGLEDLLNIPRKVLIVGSADASLLMHLLKAGHSAQMVVQNQTQFATISQSCIDAGYSGSQHVIQDEYPELANFDESFFDLIYVSFAHIAFTDEQMFDAVYRLRSLLTTGGRLKVVLPFITHSEAMGGAVTRLRIEPAKLRLLVERVGFRLIRKSESYERCEENASVICEWPGEDVERPLDRVESILNRDKKDATYKLALFRALADVVQTQYSCAHYDDSGFVSIPVSNLAQKWLAYYWPIVASDTFIAQKNGEQAGGLKPIAIRKPLEHLISSFGEGGGFSAFKVALNSGALPPLTLEKYKKALQKISTTIWNMPVKYAGGGEPFSVFGYNKQTRMVLVPEDLWRELALTGSWIHDATILRWAELTERFSKGDVPVSVAVEKLLCKLDPDRDTYAARSLFARIGVTTCVWSKRPLAQGHFDVDHVIPFSLWRNNDLWNLLPTHPVVNNSKRDKLPTQGLLKLRRDDVIDCWTALRNEFPSRFDREAATLCGVARMPVRNWKSQLYSKMREAIEITAIQRQVPRWEPATKAVKASRKTHKVVAPSMPPSAIEEQMDVCTQQDQEHVEPIALFSVHEVGPNAYQSYLPLMGKLAAGQRFNGFDMENMNLLDEDTSWLEVPRRFAAKRRFVVQVIGNSMEPTIMRGDYVVCEYHRHVQPGQHVVILADYAMSSNCDQAVKRISETPDSWVFSSDNEAYEDIVIPKDEGSEEYPILGVVLYNLNQERSVK